MIFTKFFKIISGNRKCGRDNCVTCDLVITGTSFRSTMTGKEYKFMPSVGCETNNIIYMVSFFFQIKNCSNKMVGLIPFFYRLRAKSVRSNMLEKLPRHLSKDITDIVEKLINSLLT